VFHDGSAVDALAVKDSLEKYLKSTASRFSPGLEDIVSIDATGSYLLTIRLGKRSALLLDDLDTPITKVDKNGLVIGTGPFVVTSTTTNEVVMAAFPQYYRGTSDVGTLIWRPFPTVRTAWAAAMRGEIDFLYEVGPETREFLQSETSVELYPFLRAYVYGAVFNARRSSFRNPEVRRALNYAVDRASIVSQAFRGHGREASGPAWPLHWAYDESASQYSYDPARAAASFGKLLGADSKGQSRRPAGLTFVCLVPENVQLWERLALMVQRNLAEIGVDMRLEAVPVDTFNSRITAGDFDVAMMEMVSGTSISRPFFFWRSGGLSNFSGYANPSVDAALEGIRRAPGEGEYRNAFRQFQQAIFDDPPAIFLAWGETARAVNRRFDVVKAPGGDIRMTISDWKLADPRARAAN
jgi:ABC-type transport system substrate-binding protein